MKQKKYTLIILCIVYCASLISKTNKVPGDYTSIQTAINASKTGDTVLVDPGRYFENINYRGKNIVVASKYALTKDTSFITSTIIDGSKPVHKDTASCVLMISKEGAGAVLEGFTLTGGLGTPIKGYVEGGGVLMAYSRAIIKNNLIVGNSVSAGGAGIAAWWGNPQILNNVIAHNRAEYAAGIVLNWSGGIIKNNIIYHNIKYGDRWLTGGLMVWNSYGEEKQVVENNTIIGNYSSTTSGGLSIDEGASPLVRNNIIWGNRQAIEPSVSGNTSVVTFCNTENKIAGEGNIQSFPMLKTGHFTLASGSPCIDMGVDSAVCKDIADGTNPGKAFAPSMGSLRNDLGAFGGSGAKVLPETKCEDFFINSNINFGDVNRGKSVAINLEILNVGTSELKIDTFYLINNKVKIEKGLNSKKLGFLEKDTFKISWSPMVQEKMSDTLKIFHSLKNLKNPKIIVINGNAKAAVNIKQTILNDKINVYPNPCSGKSRITFVTDHDTELQLNLIDLNGRKLQCLFNKIVTPGIYEAELNNHGLRSGIYYLQLVELNASRYEKIVIQ